MWAEWQVSLIAEDMSRELFGHAEPPADVEAGGVVRCAISQALHSSRRVVGADRASTLGEPLQPSAHRPNRLVAYPEVCR